MLVPCETVDPTRTLTGSAKTRFVPNENRDNENAPLYRLFAGRAELGAAWPAKTEGEKPFEYLSVKLDDPSFPEPAYAALFDHHAGTSTTRNFAGFLNLRR